MELQRHALALSPFAATGVGSLATSGPPITPSSKYHANGDAFVGSPGPSMTRGVDVVIAGQSSRLLDRTEIGNHEKEKEKGAESRDRASSNATARESSSSSHRTMTHSKATEDEGYGYSLDRNRGDGDSEGSNRGSRAFTFAELLTSQQRLLL